MEGIYYSSTKLLSYCKYESLNYSIRVYTTRGRITQKFGRYVNIFYRSILITFLSLVIIIMDEDQKKCGGISAVGIAAILVSLACIVIGAINIDFGNSNLDQQDISSSTCKAEPMIPFYLLVAGLLNIIIIVLRLIFQV